MDRLRRILSYQVSIAALIEVALWLALPYLTIGLVWAALHPTQVEQIEERLARVAPAGADLGAFGLVTVLWPASLQIAAACPAS
ncbi:hypothetical protein [Mycobacterium kiyosense]|uniref:Uncharacterized protein n=2 Tax=Mycobacteriaceae TaxID=1762 RepID=A0A9P3QDI4_9MYCO|nr:hypothetical protein IWGMT90018_16230 [Mycobacterium kiyosense]BDE12969.1 hypothetical protein MKCMC460_18290 [Mycobacterium sp. 20KCMC460]GLB85562.1 hypothetical protein SRL2020028_48180 [Mycobacterium kiyosense]GLB92362.1 hypothetical protein SRL2020130_51790 [Mycobacterium kiyosense]GLB98399.1 hypothetical protein SRL2020226_51750 [Mycobacterium kiyosense]